jgi:hypothetical protein
MGVCFRVLGFNPREHVVARHRDRQARIGDADVEHLFALPAQRLIEHEAELGGGIENHARPSPGQDFRDGFTRLAPARSIEDSAVSATGARVDEERGFAAEAPCARVGGIKGLAASAAVQVDAVGLADHEAAP